MGLPVLILGYSGSGKSSSMRNFKPDELALVNVNGKFLPFRGSFAEAINSDDYDDIKAFLRKSKSKIMVIDDSQYLMLNEFMRRSSEKGYDKFTEMAKNFWELIRYIESLPGDVTVYFMQHIDSDDSGRLKAKTVGKLLDEKINVEGMFSIVLRCDVKDGEHYFYTQSNGQDCCKSPQGMFTSYTIPNDLKFVDETIRTYYALVPEVCCEKCGKAITPTSKRSISQLAEASKAKLGGVYCGACGKAILEAQDGTKTVSG